MEISPSAIRRADPESRVPEPARSRWLLEVAGDLEGLYEEFRSRGLGEEAARRRAWKWLVGSDPVGDRLAEIHAPGPARRLDRWTAERSPLAEWALGSLVALGVVAGGLGVAHDTELLPGLAPAVVAVLLLGAAGLVRAFVLARPLFVRPGELTRRPRRRALELLGWALATGAIGLAAGVARLTGGAAGAPWRAVAEAAGLATLAGALTVGLGIAWYLLDRRAASIEHTWSLLREELDDFGTRAGGRER